MTETGGEEKHVVQRDVEEFHRLVGGASGETPAIRNGGLNAALIMEEAVETAEASTGRRIEWRYVEQGEQPERSLVKAIDGLCDLLCVTYSAAVTYGVNLAPFWDEVHRSNLSKQGGPVRADGKRLKPKGWRGPGIAGVLAQSRRGAEGGTLMAVEALFTEPGEFLAELDQDRDELAREIVRVTKIARPGRDGVTTLVSVEAAYRVGAEIVRLRRPCGELWGQGRDAEVQERASALVRWLEEQVAERGLSARAGVYATPRRAAPDVVLREGGKAGWAG